MARVRRARNCQQGGLSSDAGPAGSSGGYWLPSLPPPPHETPHPLDRNISASPNPYLSSAGSTRTQSMAGQSPQPRTDSQFIEDGPKGTGTPKRKEHDTPPQPRSKRNRYVSIACSECKRRKIRCNGETPCERCGHLSLECLYVPNCCSSGFKDSE